MTIQVHTLSGCTPTPLAHYLKGLGVLRVVAQQKDPSARGFFRHGVFRLASRLTSDELNAFFLEEYAPSPLLTPWNGGSGFYPRDNKSGIDQLRNSSARRFADYTDAIRACAAVVGDRAEAPKDGPKAELQARCRQALSDRGVDWMAAAVVVASDASEKPAYPALLGSGGNDGRLDFTNNFMQRLMELFDPSDGRPRRSAVAQLAPALFGTTSRGLEGGLAIGQFLPGAAGGFNAANGFAGESLVNPWDFVLMLEGAILFGVSATRRLDSSSRGASAPFAVRAAAAGYGSAADADASARGEQWMPVWSSPATLGEIRRLFAEGRMQLGRDSARSALDAARALSTLGVSRGIDSFERFGYFERNGQANLAVPIGRFRVEPRPAVRLLDEIEDWVLGLRRAGDAKSASAANRRAIRDVDSATISVIQRGSSADWQGLLLALGNAESAWTARGRFAHETRARPIPALSPRWLDLADDGSLEFRVAAATASVGAGPLGAHIRGNLLPLEAGPGVQLAFGAESLRDDPRVVIGERDLILDFVAVAARRMAESRQAGLGRWSSTSGVLNLSLADVGSFVAGPIDDGKVLALLRPLMAIDWRRGATDVQAVAGRWSVAASVSRPDPALALFRCLYATCALTDRPLALETAAFARLSAGRAREASELAVRRLEAAGIRLRISHILCAPREARRIAAAILLPLSVADHRRCLRSIQKTEFKRSVASAEDSGETQ